MCWAFRSMGNGWKNRRPVSVDYDLHLLARYYRRWGYVGIDRFVKRGKKRENPKDGERFEKI